MNSTHRGSVVLYAEDSDDDAFLMQRAFTKLKFSGSLVVVRDGAEAIDYLGGEGRYADRNQHPLPCLILLDIKMPQLGGIDVLKWVRERDSFRDVPVLMLTSSSQETDIRAAYGLGADCYLVKPANLNRFAELVEDVTAICSLTTRPAGGFRVRGAVPAPDAAVSS
jgi:CheY-like chemotaxis protein